MGVTSVDLGFFEDDFDPWELESRHFPSKIGGKPAWLDLKHLPAPEELQCPQCSSPMAFLMQLYCPDDSNTSAFHRTIFLFICTTSNCWSNPTPPILVLRSQLARTNPYYPSQSPEDNPNWRPDIVVGKHCTVCGVCGCRGEKLCGRCRGVTYCGENHQRRDWKAGHKSQCSEGAVYQGSKVKWALKEGIMEREAEPDEEEGATEEEDDKYKDLIDGGIDVEEAELDEIESGQVVDKVCDKFRQRVRRAPDQILRYDRRGKPLLCAAQPALTTPENCKQCGGSRSFEFQVMPQLLSELQLGLEAEGGVDWGSLYIFTCDKSCKIEGYIKEQVQLVHFEMTNLPGT